MSADSAKQPIEARRLRATLRLCFVSKQSDELAARIRFGEPDPIRALAPMMRLARLNFTAYRWLSLVRRLRTCVPLRPRPHLPAIPALALALHLGLDLRIDQLGRLFGHSTDEISLALQQGRRAVDPSHITPCPEFMVSIGRYRDPSQDRSERLNLMKHFQHCERCQLALEQSRQLDDRLIATIKSTQNELTVCDAQPKPSRSIWLAPALFGVLVSLLAIAVVIAGVTASHRLLPTHSTPVPLLAAGRYRPQFTGWLLERSQANGVDAINVATGQQRALIPSLPASGSVVYVSPNDSRLAVGISAGPPQKPTLRIYRIDGSLIHQWPLDDSNHSDSPLGWLDPSHFLITQDPHRPAAESPTHFRNRLPSVEQLVSLNVDTGSRQVVLNGQVFDAQLSPDGHYLALDRKAGTGPRDLEIRPVSGDKLGSLVARFDGSFLTSTVWTPDSQKIVFFSPTTGSFDVAGSVDTMSVAGKVTPLRELPFADDFPIPLVASTTMSEPVNYTVVSVSPDGRRIVFAEGTSHIGNFPLFYRIMPIGGGTPRKLAYSSESLSLLPSTQPLWSPNGESLALTVEEPYIMPHPQQSSSLTSINSYVTLAFDARGDSLGALFDQFTDHPPFAWLPQNALPATEQSQSGSSGSFHVAGPAQGIGVTPQLTENSRLSPDGIEALIYDRTYRFSLAASANGTQPLAAGPAIDPSWLPASSGGIGVQQHTRNGRTTSRITIYGQGSFNGGMTPLDFDPARLGNNITASYREPMLAPNGLHYSFFVVDGNVVDFWVGGLDQQPMVVSHWTLPPDAKTNPPLIASWVNNDTVVFSEPDEWMDGLPQHVMLKRVTFTNGKAPDITSLTGWHARGSDAGIVLQELRLSPGTSKIAFRLRHYTGINLTKDRFDSLLVAESVDLTQSVELVRGSYGDGMSWSPDGRELVAVIDGGLQVMTSDGSNVQNIDAGKKAVSYPVWVSQNEIWYESGTGNTAQVMVAKR